MLGTIASSWEFVDYVFLIDGVSRAFTHQLVRTRQGSYAQQSQRTVNMSGFDYVTPDGLEPDIFQIDEGKDKNRAELYKNCMNEINKFYKAMIDEGVNPQDARGVLPTNIETNIIAKFNLRTLSHMAEERLCTRTQGEYQNVFRAIRDCVLEVHPWAEPFIRVYCAAHGICRFPNYHECPIKPPIFNPESGRRWDNANDVPATKDDIQHEWEKKRFEAVPQGVK